MIRTATLLTPALLTLLATAPLNAADTTPCNNIASDQSTIVATFEQEGVRVESPFTAFSGHIAFNPDDAAASSASLAVKTASFDLGDPMYNAEVRKQGWFDSDNHPEATFTATAIEATGDSGFNATGELTIKGVTDTVTIPITVTDTAGGHAFAGNFDMSRRTFGIGDPMWDDVLEDTVNVRFHLVTTGE